MKPSLKTIEQLLALAWRGISALPGDTEAERRLYDRCRAALIPSPSKITDGRGRRNKGRSGERDAVLYLKDQGFGPDVKRGFQSRGGGKEQADVLGTGCLFIEVKRVEKLNIHAALQQACDDASEGKIPIVLHRRNNEKWKVTMRADDFFAIFRESSYAGREVEQGEQKIWTCPQCLTQHEVSALLGGFEPEKDCQICALIP